MFFAVAVVAVWSFLADYSAKATAAGLFCDQYRYLATEWRRLWYEGATQEEVTALRQQFDRIASGYDLPIDDALNGKAQNDAYQVLAADFSSDGEEWGAAAGAAKSS